MVLGCIGRRARDVVSSVALWAVLSLYVWTTALPAQAAGVASEAAVKAAFLYRFVGFVEWPAKARSKDGIVIGMYGADDVESALRGYVKSKKSPISVRRIEDTDDIDGIHILFVGAEENAQLSELVPALRGKPVLIVTEAPDGLTQGSMINFVTSDRVRFEVAVDAATKAGIRLNARLLSVAMRIKKGEMPGEGWLASQMPDDTAARCA